ncbi:MAG: hypothetical protein HGA80_00310 [Candidatus Omnitrophica bacterium]|nr:hypothetical protein [Candidatus Omnitrophota bacterium]
MLLIYLLIGVVLAAFGVVAWMVYSARVEAEKAQEDMVVPIEDLSSFNKKHVHKDELLSGSAPGEGVVSHEVGSNVGERPVSAIPGVVAATDNVQFAASELSMEKTAMAAKPDLAREDELRTLKEEVRLIREKAVIQARNAIEVINKLREQAENLRAENASLARAGSVKLDSDNLIASLEAEKVSLVEELHAKRQEVELLREELARRQASALDAGMGEVTAGGESEHENSPVLGGAEGMGGRVPLVEELTSLRKAAEMFREDRDRLAAEAREAEARCAIQLEKNVFLQYELTKSRAQAVGMERVSENARKQVEDMVRQVGEMRLANKELQSRYVDLGNSVEDLKRLNAELIRRERLASFKVNKDGVDGDVVEQVGDVFRSRLERARVGDVEGVI